MTTNLIPLGLYRVTAEASPYSMTVRLADDALHTETARDGRTFAAVRTRSVRALDYIAREVRTYLGEGATFERIGR